MLLLSAFYKGYCILQSESYLPTDLESKFRQCDSKPLVLKHKNISIFVNLWATPEPNIQVIVYSLKQPVLKS